MEGPAIAFLIRYSFQQFYEISSIFKIKNQ